MSGPTTSTRPPGVDRAADPWGGLGRPIVHLAAACIIGALLGSLDGVLASSQDDLAPLPPAGNQATIGLSLSLVLPVVVFLGLLAGGFAWSFTRLLTPTGLESGLRKWWIRAGIGGVGLLVGAAGAYVLGRKEIDWKAVDYTLPVMLLAGGLAYVALVAAMRRLRLVPLLGAIAVVLGSGVAGMLAYSSAGDARGAAITRVSDETSLAKRVLRRAMPFFDRDRDGFPTALCAAGCDCNDADPDVHPGARDVAGNGVDEDCSGGDESIQAEAEYAAVFASGGAVSVPGTTAEEPAPPPSPSRLALPGPTVAPMAGILPLVPGSTAPPKVLDKAPAPKAKPKPTSAGSDAKGSKTDKTAKPSAPTKRRPNILMITIDTLRADHLGVYGYERNTSPRLDDWAASAVVFEQARVTGPSTRFSVAPAMLSKWFTEIKRGKYEWPVLSDDETFLSERLRALGYTTAAFHSIRYFRKQYGFDQGFDHYSVDALDKRGPPLHMVSSDFITDEVLGYFDATLSQTDKPWFVWAYYGDPHSAYVFHKEAPRFGPLYRDTYDNEIAFVDLHLGRLFDGLEARGQWKNTVVVLWSDHGEGLDPAEDHGTKYHSKNLYDELIRVPLIIGGPGMKPRRVGTVVSMIDLVPTLMGWLGEDRDPSMRGMSLVPYIEGDDPPHPPVFAEKHRKKDNPQKAMIMWPYKVIAHFPQMHIEIYDLAKDPKERQNIAATLEPATKKRLMGVFRHWLGKVLTPHKPNYRH